jgi:ABC-type branched-subunit amino acid transport system ATPase component
LKLAARAYVIENGRVVFEGRGSDLLDDRRVQESYLGGESSGRAPTPEEKLRV